MDHKKGLILFTFCFLLSAFITGCGNDAEKVPDTSDVKITLVTHRFDKDLYAIDTNHIGEGLQQLAVKYPDFLNYFLDTLMAYGIHGNYSDTVAGVREGLRPFLVFKDYKDLADTIQKHYPDTKVTDEILTSGFKLMKHYFPDFPVPEVYYVSLGLSKWPTFPVDSNTMCVALDMFLGDGFPHYAAIGVPGYMNAHLRESYIPVSVFSSLYKTSFPFTTNDKNLLELMMQRGKEQYFLHKILPGLPDSVLFGYRQMQVDWCNANEAFVYNFFIHQKLLYSTEAQNIMSYVTDGPFARGLEQPNKPVKETPGSIGTWLGYRIVTAYMEQNPKVTLRELLQTKHDPVAFLEMARYKPR